MTIEDRSGSVEALVFASAAIERLAPLVVEDQAVVVRGLALPEEGGPPRRSRCRRSWRWTTRAWIMPTVISIRVWLGRGNGSRGQARRRSGEIFRRKPGETQVRLRLEAPRDFSVLLDRAGESAPRQANSARLWSSRSAGRKRLRSWRGSEGSSPNSRRSRPFSKLVLSESVTGKV
jgi:hypothetical protein